MGTTSDKLSYLSTTKDKLKTAINYTGANITNDTFRSYPEKLYNKYIDIINNGTGTLYSNMPKVNGQGSSLTLNNTESAPMLLSLYGNTSQSGTPTPSSPQPIHNVSGDNTIVVEGKNLFDKDSVVGGFLNTDGTVGGDTNAYRTSDFIPIQPNTAYYKTITDSPRTKYYDSNKQPLNTTTYQDISIGGNAGTFTTPNNACYLRFSYPIASVDSNNIMVHKGSTSSEYEAYTRQSQLISLGVENLFDKDNTTIEMGTIETTGSFSPSTIRVRAYYIEVNEETQYTISTSNSDLSIVPYYYNSSKTFVSYDNGWKTMPFTFTTPINTKYVAFLFKNSDNTITPSSLTNMQLEKGSKANSYSPYGASYIELNKIGNYQDYIYKTDKWYLHKEIGKIVLDGTNVAFTYESQETLPNSLMIPASSRPRGVSDTSSLITSHFSNIQAGSGSTLNTLYWGASTQMWLCKDGFNSIANGNAWLSSNNVILYYVLATPTDTEITDTTLLEQLNNLEQIKSKKNQTNINQENNDLPFIITASALKEYE